eukprot:evm.model.scf_2305.1 EVM.evm.TU.scf_2305.1   scf_2305:5508-14061(+)
MHRPGGPPEADSDPAGERGEGPEEKERESGIEMPGRGGAAGHDAPSPSQDSAAVGQVQVQALPLFKQNFLASRGARAVSYRDPEIGGGGGRGVPPRLPGIPSRSRDGGQRQESLLPLELSSVSRRLDGPPTETEARRRRLKHYELQCTHTFEHMHIGGHMVAKSREILRGAGITHVINCVRFEYDNYFQDEMKYLGLYLQDWGQEDIYCVFYDAFDFIEAAREGGGKVFIHCSQGVSRSAAITIAYIMWRTDRHVEVVLDQMKQVRAVVEPNIGFYFQLIAWDKRRKTIMDKCNIYRAAPLSKLMSSIVVAKNIPKTGDANEQHCLDPRGAFIVHCPQRLYVWIGDQCPEAFLRAARKFALQLGKYENAPKATEVRQGEEDSELASALGFPPNDASGLVRQRDEFTPEFERYHRALAPKLASGDEPPLPPMAGVRRNIGRRAQSDVLSLLGEDRHGRQPPPGPSVFGVPP